MADIVATYRLQLHAGFPLAAARDLVGYLSRLGVSHIHASPLLKARTGSTHGYDVVDPTRLDPALGTEDDLAALHAELQRRGMGLVLDVVPNHMAASHENPAWDDVLAHGQASPFARWFDIDWRTGTRGTWSRVLLPVLGAPRAEALARSEIALAVEEQGIRVRYHERSFPLDPSTLPQVLAAAQVELRATFGADHLAVQELDRAVGTLRRAPRRTARRPGAVTRRRELSADALARLSTLRVDHPAAAEMLAHEVSRFGEGMEGRRRLRLLLDAQVYRLAYWRRAAREINYRRFFDINDLVALQMQDPEVFAQTHALVLEWRRRGWIDGFRIDHPDGLLDPLAYFRSLESAAFGPGTGNRPAVWAEKILSHGEALRRSWPVAGTTGYDFLNQGERLFLSPEGLRTVETEYRRILRRPVEFAAIALWGKRLVLDTALSSGVRALARRVVRIDDPGAPAGDSAVRSVMRALVEVIVCLPVYRTYIDGSPGPPDEADVRLLRTAVEGARLRGRAETAAIDVVEGALLGGGAPRGEDAEARRRRFVQRFQQLSGPAIAKGIEDTAFYRFAAHFSTNEVGGAPDVALASAEDEFHAAAGERAANWPAAMLATTTHDTKRTADVRARLDVLTEIPEEWAKQVARWRRQHLRYKQTVRERRVPDPNSVYHFLQAMVGIWPEEPPCDEELAKLRERITAYAVKAAREAKERTSWTDPDEEFEAALTGSIEALLTRERSPLFLDGLQRFTTRIAAAGRWNALSRTLLHLASPGTPDVYQGDELWNHALVDPDNRRPVDFAHRERLLDGLEREWDGARDGGQDFLAALVASAADGRIKMHVVRQALRARGRRSELRGGAYHPLRAEGPAGANIIAFGRSSGDSFAVVAVPRLIARGIVRDLRPPTDPALWAGTSLRIPASWPSRWTCALSGDTVIRRDRECLGAEDVFRRLPAALLLGDHPT